MLTEDEIKALMREQIDPFESQNEWARRLRVSPSTVSQVLGGKVPVPPSLARALGYRRVVRFEKVSEE